MAIPYGKRQLPRGVRCVIKSFTLHPRHVKMLESMSRGIIGGQSEIIRRLIDNQQRANDSAAPTTNRGVLN